jgi:hypothetical protein
MTKKDYITIANALKPFYQGEYSNYENYKLTNDEIIVRIVQTISQQIKQDNPTFDPVKFLDYLRA